MTTELIKLLEMKMYEKYVALDHFDGTLYLMVCWKDSNEAISKDRNYIPR